MQHIIKELSNKLKETNMTQKEFADKINMNTVVLHRILNCKENKSLNNLLKVVNGLGFELKLVESKLDIPKIEKILVHYEGTDVTRTYTIEEYVEKEKGES